MKAAKKIASHAVIGSGPLQFFADPGKSGFELSALNRITKTHTTYGFRTTSAEGGRPFNLDKYGKAIYGAWRLKHEKGSTVEKIATEEGISARFLQHISTVLNQPSAPYPTGEVIARFQKMPGTRAAATEIQKYLVEWTRWLFGAGALAEGGQGDERALVLTEETVSAAPKQKLRFNLFNRGTKAPGLSFMTAVVNPNSADRIFVPMIIGLALMEALCLYALVIAFFLQGKI